MTEPKSEYYRRGYARAMLKLAQFAAAPRNPIPEIGDAAYPSLYVPSPEVAREYAEALRAYNEMQQHPETVRRPIRHIFGWGPDPRRMDLPSPDAIKKRWEAAQKALQNDAIAAAGGNPELEDLRRQLHELEIAKKPDQKKIQAMRARIASLPGGKSRLYNDASYDAARAASGNSTLRAFKLNRSDVDVYRQTKENADARLKDLQSQLASLEASRNPDQDKIKELTNQIGGVYLEMQNLRANADLGIRETVMSQARIPSVAAGFIRDNNPAEIERHRNNMRMLQQGMRERADRRKALANPESRLPGKYEGGVRIEDGNGNSLPLSWQQWQDVNKARSAASATGV